ncbi:hypothetical protein LCGC14_0463850 [marine sediment metagenome]|uniref:Uncharacterized protein n=1 Tax=marine sediment metagenome TaxID=412755 RepID=A0A0F9SX47_9ZZZZ
MKINEIHLLSNGWVQVKVNGNWSKRHSGAYSVKFIEKLKKDADKDTILHGLSDGHIEFAVDNMNKYGKPK